MLFISEGYFKTTYIIKKNKLCCIELGNFHINFKSYILIPMSEAKRKGKNDYIFYRAPNHLFYPPALKPNVYSSEDK